jgi:polysaccharide biosynthesis protein PslH
LRISDDNDRRDFPRKLLAGAGDSAALRLLLLLHSPPRLDAREGGATEVARRIELLAERYAVGVLYLRAPGEAAVDPALAGRCALVEEVPRRSTAFQRAGRVRRGVRILLATLPGTLPVRAKSFSVADFHRRVREVVAEWQPHVVQAEHRIMAQYLPDVPATTARRVLVEHDSQRLLLRELATSRSGAARLATRLDAIAWSRYERETGAGGLDGVVAFSERDRDALAAQAPAARIVIIPPVVGLPERPADPLGVSPPRLLFVGMFLHLPNVDAAERLTESILPRVRASFPSASLDLVGPHLPAGVRGEGVVVAGDVPDVRPYLDRAAVVTAPLRLGSGVRIKVLEALAAGKAVVASPRAVEGIDVVAGEQLVVADADGDFAAAVVELLQRPERRAELASAARRWAERELAAHRYVGAYTDFYERLLGEERQAQ